jgi:glycine oxidase
MGGITVRSCLELLSALYSLHPGFAESEVLETSVNCRPAYPDNLPRIRFSPGDMRINGLYRHGFLLGPRITDIACRVILGGTIDPNESKIVAVTRQ